MVLIIAHRGASGHRPEHTEAAVRLGFALGADAVEPDLVPSRDGILVVRHEPEIGGTTDVAERPEFADRRRVLRVPPSVVSPDPLPEVEGWWTWDFDWAELATLRARERLPELRPESAAHDGEAPILRFRDLLDLLDELGGRLAAPPVLVAEIKHAVGFASLGYDMAELFLAELGDRVPAARLVVESFELPVLLRLRELGLAGTTVFLSADPQDAGELAGRVDGVSYYKGTLLAEGGAALVEAAHAAGLLVYAWTLRPENAFLETRWRVGEDQAAWGDWRGEYAAVLATGVDGVFADYPEQAVSASGRTLDR